MQAELDSTVTDGEGEHCFSNWLSGYSTQDIITSQRGDSNIKEVHQWFDQEMKPSRDEIASKGAAVRRYWPNYDCLFWREGVLYQRWMLSGDQSVCYNQLLVPRGMQKEVIEMCHDTRLGGHLGVNKIIDKICQRFHWYKLGNAVRNYIRKCPVCCANRHQQKRLRAALKDYRVGHPLDRIGVDVLGPSNKQRKLLHPRSGLVEAYLKPDQQAGTTATKLVYEFISRYSVPLEVHTDQG